jgi:hypothetical protein
MRARAVPITALAVLAAAAPTAAADKAPTASQRAAIARGADTPARCLIIRVSTVSSGWGSYRFDADRYSSCKRYAADGIAIVRRSGTTWRQRYAGSDCRTPATKYMPRRVWRDLSADFCGR